ncbi:hypothetical protein FB561_1397 [Kribbella amoyensis]|uniref:Uncharacterized protein n=1 Tax=Kribbella amoyensis TaxID=996641 RepID=A0A561BND7_9ACTN|nr:hypothetical protein [Kribbella amoyensis]TWD80323.1 hypothetical protein FB561_1397 [Kribbella amoyensis]
MTDTELKDRLSATVVDVEAPPDLLDRARSGGRTRLRRRRFLALGASLAAVAAAGGVAATTSTLRGRSDDLAATPAPGATDPYGFLMTSPTRGDLAGDEEYLDQVLAAWRGSHRKSANHYRGIFDRLQGRPKVVWAGTTPAGRAAIVAQYSDLRHHEDIQLDREGVQTLVGFVGEGKDGRPTVVADSYPAPGVSLDAGFVTTQGENQALVVLDTGKRTGWSPGRHYNAQGGSGREYTPLRFENGVSVVALPPGTDLADLALSVLPTSKDSSSLSIANGGVNRAPIEQGKDERLWTDFPEFALWPMTESADSLRGTAADQFDGPVSAARDPDTYAFAMSLWTGYGVTADKSHLFLGEIRLDNDPTRTYAVLKSRSGRITITPGGVPDRDAALPVSIKLPGGQGWAVAQRDADLSYRFGAGSWSKPRQNALLVPAGPAAEVKVVQGDKETVVTLR